MNTVAQTWEAAVALFALLFLGLAGTFAVRKGKGSSSAEYFLSDRRLGVSGLTSSLFLFLFWCMIPWSVEMPLSINTVGLLIGLLVVGIALLAMFAAPAYLRKDAATVPGYFSVRYSRRVGIAVSVAVVALTLVVRVPLVIILVSRILNVVLGWEALLSALLIIVVPGLFAVAGGAGAMFAMHKAGSIIVALAIVAFFLTGSPGLESAFAAGSFALSPLAIGGLAVMTVWMFCADQFVVQRVLAAESKSVVRRGAVVTLIAACVALGLLAVRLGSTNGVIAPTPFAEGITAGLLGGAVLVVGMATLSAHFLSVSAVATLDLFRWSRTPIDEGGLVLVGRFVNAVVVIVAICVAASMALIGARSLEWLMRAVLVVAVPVAAVWFVGMLSARMHAKGAEAGLGLGWVTGGVLMFVSRGDEFGAALEAAALTFAVSAVVHVAVSLAASPQDVHAPDSETLVHKGFEVPKS